MSDMPEEEFSAYVDMLFLGRLSCAVCGAEFARERPKQHDESWAIDMARDAIAQGWRLHPAEGSKILCPACTSRPAGQSHT